ncbi:MAG: UDP-N-acetylmuramate dehydrogenase [Myxococcales bacterium]|nr:UDP-N-acetylmuramate dehydrogenase [Myxococcales bacterium]
MRRHTTLKIGGPADAYAEPRDSETVVALVRYCAAEGLPITTIGGGSNLLVRDGGIRGFVLATRALRNIERVADAQIEVDAGLSTGKLLSSATKWELGGLEFLGGVPGSVGGGLVMNAGTYLGEFKDVTTAVRSLRLRDGELISRSNAECSFGYRSSSLPPSEVVLGATLTLEHRPTDQIKEVVTALRARRKEREPAGANNAGSVFKNPEGDHAGRLIEAVGFKGTRIGSAECSPAHANWFVNHGDAKAADMLELIAQARAKVRAQMGVDLVLEWKCIGED